MSYLLTANMPTKVPVMMPSKAPANQHIRNSPWLLVVALSNDTNAKLDVRTQQHYRA